MIILRIPPVCSQTEHILLVEPTFLREPNTSVLLNFVAVWHVYPDPDSDAGPGINPGPAFGTVDVVDI